MFVHNVIKLLVVGRVGPGREFMFRTMRTGATSPEIAAQWREMKQNENEISRVKDSSRATARRFEFQISSRISFLSCWTCESLSQSLIALVHQFLLFFLLSLRRQRVVKMWWTEWTEIESRICNAPKNDTKLKQKLEIYICWPTLFLFSYFSVIMLIDIGIGPWERDRFSGSFFFLNNYHPNTFSPWSFISLSLSFGGPVLSFEVAHVVSAREKRFTGNLTTKWNVSWLFFLLFCTVCCCVLCILSSYNCIDFLLLFRTASMLILIKFFLFASFDGSLIGQSLMLSRGRQGRAAVQV